MAAEHVVAARKARVSERLEAVRSRLSALLGLDDYSDNDVPGVVKRDAKMFDLVKSENLLGFLEGVATRLSELRTQIADLNREIDRQQTEITLLQSQLTAAYESEPQATAKAKSK